MDAITLKMTVKNAVKEAMSEQDKIRIRKLQSDLIRIDNKERFFFNIEQYKSLGLIKEKDLYGLDATGK